MTHVTAAALAMVLGGAIDVPAGAPLADALARARPGDVIRLGAGLHEGSLGRAAGLRFEGAGSDVTVVTARPGEDGAVAPGALALSGLTLRAGPERCALKVLGGEAHLDDVVLAGGACGAFVDGGRLDGREVVLGGGYGLLARGGEVALEGGGARGAVAGVALLAGTLSLRRFTVVGPSREAGITVAGGVATLEGVSVLRPGPSGISVSGAGRVDGVAVSVAGAIEESGMLGDCAQVLGGTLRLEGATLVGCAGAAVEASRGEVRLAGVDATGGSAGCIVLVNGSSADLAGNLCAGRGPGLVAASRSEARLRDNRWWTDPVLSVDCGSGARVEPGRGEKMAPPCGRR